MLSKRSVFSTAIMLPFAAADAGNLDCWIKPPGHERQLICDREHNFVARGTLGKSMHPLSEACGVVRTNRILRFDNHERSGRNGL
jgi:hypothetical protein